MRLLIIIFILFVFIGCKSKSEHYDMNISLKKEEGRSDNIFPVIDESTLPHRTVYTSSIEDLFQIFKDMGYDDKKWYEGTQIIPRIYLQRISSRWKGQSSELDVSIKKDIFFKLITPAILRSNEFIQIERNHLLLIVKNHLEMDKKNREWLIKLAKKYKILGVNEPLHVNNKFFKELLKRVDTIAPSLALAQAAEESGWATSRFASEGNALFGQWTRSKTAMIPNRQREQFSDFGLARFKTPQDSVNSYMLNLNTHNAYKKLREKRYRLRKEAKAVTGLALSETLDKYSERGYEYVNGLKKMIRYNHLAHFDNSKLWNKEVILLTPKISPKKSTSEVNQSLVIN